MYDRLLERVAALPGVRTAALTSIVPLGGDNDMDVAIEGQPPPPPGQETTTWYRLVSADYMKAMGIALRQGRGFVPREPTLSVIVNETAARRFWPGQDPVGRRVRFGSETRPSFTVIGVAGDVSMRGAARRSSRRDVPALLAIPGAGHQYRAQVQRGPGLGGIAHVEPPRRRQID